MFYAEKETKEEERKVEGDAGERERERVSEGEIER